MASPLRLGIVAADFHEDLAEEMITAAREEAGHAHALIGEIVRVAGSYEMPLAAALLLERENIDALVVLGYIERGETLHGEVMGHVVHQALVHLSLEHHKPVGMGVIGPGATLEQARSRADEYPRSAVRAALRLAETARTMATSTAT